MKKLVIPIFLLLLTSHVKAQTANTDNPLGKLVKTITNSAQFVLFDEADTNRVILKCLGFDVKMIYGAPEMKCFVANHLKDDLRATYELYDRETADGSTIRSSKLIRLISLRSGDDSKTWLEKEQSDSTLAARHHEQLAKVTQGMAR